MFGITLKHEERRALLELLGYMAKTDREITPREREFILNTAHDLNTSSEHVLDFDYDKSLEEICDDFATEESRRYALAKAIELGFIDDAYVEDEWMESRRIGKMLGVKDLEVAEFEDWVSRGLKWKKEGRKLLTKGD